MLSSQLNSDQLLQLWFDPQSVASITDTKRRVPLATEGQELALNKRSSKAYALDLEPAGKSTHISLPTIRTIETAWNSQRERLLEQLLHDLKSPLASMELFLEMKERFGSSSVDEKNIVPELRTGCRRLDSLLEVHKCSAFLLKSPITYDLYDSHLGNLLQYEWESFLISQRKTLDTDKVAPGPGLKIDSAVAKAALRLLYNVLLGEGEEGPKLVNRAKKSGFALTGIDPAAVETVFNAETIPRSKQPAHSRAGILAARQAAAILSVFGILITPAESEVLFQMEA